MSSSMKKVLIGMIAALVILIVIIVILATRDTVVKEPEQMGETIIAEKVTEPATQAEPETEEAAPQPEVVDLPNEKEVRLYVDNGGVMQLVSQYSSVWTPDADIAIFEAFNSEQAEISYDDYYTVHEIYWNAVETETRYKIGYELSFAVNGEKKVYTILEPQDISGNPDLFMGDAAQDEVTGYMGAWVYNDIGQTGVYIHLTQEEMTDDVLMTSIKLRPTPQSDQITDFRLKVFSYSSEAEFDDQGHYIGTHGYEIPVINEG
ncbi:MAG: hypothetical protein IJ106_03940 [Parasporobacterium sp.]|nr:hypothetical protein [Parasporobacterium sp.]